MLRLATLAAWIINGTTPRKEPLMPESLLPKEPQTREEVERARREVLRQFGEE